MVRTWWFHCHGPGSTPDQGTKILQAVRHSQKKKKTFSNERKLRKFVINGLILKEQEERKFLKLKGNNARGKLGNLRRKKDQQEWLIAR